IACYLRAGLPVIVNESASISGLLQREGCGISVNGGKDIGSAITQISQNYEQFSGQACRMFEKHLDFGRAFHEVIERIDSLKEDGQNIHRSRSAIREEARSNVGKYL